MVKDLLELNEFVKSMWNCASPQPAARGYSPRATWSSVPYKQIIIAAGEGAKAALSACEYVLRES